MPPDRADRRVCCGTGVLLAAVEGHPDCKQGLRIKESETTSAPPPNNSSPFSVLSAMPLNWKPPAGKLALKDSASVALSSALTSVKSVCKAAIGNLPC